MDILGLIFRLEGICASCPSILTVVVVVMFREMKLGSCSLALGFKEPEEGLCSSPLRPFCQTFFSLFYLSVTDDALCLIVFYH